MYIELTADAGATLTLIAEGSAQNCVEIFKALHIVAESNLENDEPFALVNERYHVHAIRVRKAKTEIVLVVDTQGSQAPLVVDFPSVPTQARRSSSEKDALAKKAMRELGIVPESICLI